MTLAFTSSLSLVMTGWSGVGKTEQARRVFNATDADGSHPFRPMLVITCEQSTTATMGDVLSSPDCAVANVDNLEDFTAALAALDEGLGGQPYRSVFFDGWTALTEGSKGDVRQLALAEAGDKKTLDGHSNQNDERKISAAANREARTALRLWSAAGSRHPGLLMLSTAHADELWIPKPQKPGERVAQGERIQVGVKLDLPPKASRWLLNGANLCFYFIRKLVDVGDLDSLDDLDAQEVAPSYYVLTFPVEANGFKYECVKWQSGVFKVDAETGRCAVPVKWNSPDLGAALIDSPLRVRAAHPVTPKIAAVG